MRARVMVLAGACLAAALALPSAASAAFPGKNGKIAFAGDRAGNLDVWVMNAEGGGARNLTAGSAAVDTAPAWSPDGKRIAFRSERADEDGDIFVMGADGSRPRNLTADWPHRVNDASFTPDGKRIVFTGASPSEDAGEGVFFIDARGGQPKPVFVSNSKVHTISGATISPEGELVGFTSTQPLCCPTASNALLLAFPRGSDPREGEVAPFPFYSDSEGRFFEDFSPDGSTIAFSVLLDQFETFVIPTAEKEGRGTSLTPGTQTTSDGAAFSPDGKLIALRRGTGPCCDFRDDIWVMGADGSNPRNLTNSQGPDETRPAWQPIPQPHKLRRLKRNKRRGTGKLVVKVPAQGKVVIAGKGLARKRKRARAAGKVRMPVKPKGKVRKRLRKRGKARVRAKVTYTRTGSIPIKQRKRLRLVRR